LPHVTRRRCADARCVERLIAAHPLWHVAPESTIAMPQNNLLEH
jgi:hypothetical protein